MPVPSTGVVLVCTVLVTVKIETSLICVQIIKDFYLLGRGELYQVFIDHAQHMLKTPPTAVTEHGALRSQFEHASLTMLHHVYILNIP